MDERIRDLERHARSGDADAAHRLLVEASRADDIQLQFDALMLIAEAQYPGLMEQLRTIKEMVQQVEVQEVEIAPPEWTTEITIDPTSTGSITFGALAQ